MARGEDGLLFASRTWERVDKGKRGTYLLKVSRGCLLFKRKREKLSPGHHERCVEGGETPTSLSLHRKRYVSKEGARDKKPCRDLRGEMTKFPFPEGKG